MSQQLCKSSSESITDSSSYSKNSFWNNLGIDNVPAYYSIRDFVICPTCEVILADSYELREQHNHARRFQKTTKNKLFVSLMTSGRFSATAAAKFNHLSYAQRRKLLCFLPKNEDTVALTVRHYHENSLKLIYESINPSPLSSATNNKYALNKKDQAKMNLLFKKSTVANNGCTCLFLRKSQIIEIYSTSACLTRYNNVAIFDISKPTKDHCKCQVEGILNAAHLIPSDMKYRNPFEETPIYLCVSQNVQCFKQNSITSKCHCVSKDNFKIGVSFKCRVAVSLFGVKIDKFKNTAFAMLHVFEMCTFDDNDEINTFEKV